MKCMYFFIIAGALSAGTLSAMEPWLAASISEKSLAVRPQTPAQQLQAKRAELNQINNQLKTASASTKVTLMNRKAQLETEIAALEKQK